MKSITEQYLEKSIQILFFLWAIIIPVSTAGMQIIMGFLIFINIIYYIIQKKLPFKFHPFYYLIALFIISHIFSAVFSQNYLKSISAAFGNDWTLLTIPFLVSLPITSIWRKRAFLGLLFSASVAGIIGIIQSISGIDFIKGYALAEQNNYYRAIGTYSSFLTFGGNQLFALAISLSFFSYQKLKIKIKSIILISSIVIILSIIASFSRNTWIATIFVIILATIVLYPKKVFYVFSGLVISGISLILFFPNLFARFQSIFDFNRTEGRFTLWATAWEIFKDYPLFGVGSGYFPEFFLKYKVPGFYDAYSHAHNDFINITVSNGLLGLITWSCLWVGLFYFIIKAIREYSFTELDKQILYAAIIGISGILVAAMFQCFYTDLENNIFWWFLATTALQIIVQQKEKFKLKNI